MPAYVLSAKVTATLDQSSVQATKAQLEKASSVKGSVDLTISPAAARALKDLRDSMDAVVAGIGKLNSSSNLNGLQNGTVRVTAATRAQSQLAAQTRATAKELTSAGDSMEQFGRRAGLAASRFVAFTAAAGPIVGVAAAIRSGIAEAIKFDLELNKLKQVSGDTAGRIGEIRDEVTRLATSLGVSSTALAGAAGTLRQAGLSARETKELLEGVAKASLAPNFKDIKEITEGAIAAYQQFGKTAKETKEILGAINAVAGDFASEASDLVTALQKAGGAFAATGGKANELIALMSAVRSTTRESADSIATGLRTIFTRLQRDDTTNALKALQINLRYTREEAQALGDANLADQFVGAYEAIRRVSEGLSGLRTTDSRFSAAIEALGGYRQVSRVVPLIQQFTEAQKALNVAKIGSLSIDQAAETRQAAVETRINKMREAFQKFFNTLVQSEGFNALINSLGKVADVMSRVLDVAVPLLPVIAAVAGAKLATSLPSVAAGLLTPHQYQAQGYTAPAPSGRYAKKFAGGGSVVPGVGNSDSVYSGLPAGSFVLRKSAAQSVGYGALSHFAEGGPATFAQIKRQLASAYRGSNDPRFRGVVGNELYNASPFPDRPLFGSEDDHGHSLTLLRALGRAQVALRRSGIGEPGILKALKMAGGRELGAIGEVVSFDGAVHSAGFPIRDGDKARILTPGVSFTVPTYGKPGQFGQYLARPAAVGRYAGGGDVVPAMLTPGEFVFSPNAAQSIGVGNLRHMNQTGRLPGYNKGGLVGYADGGLIPGLDEKELIKLMGLDTKFKRSPSGTAQISASAVQASISKLGDKVDEVLADSLLKGIQSFDVSKVKGELGDKLFTKVKSHVNATMAAAVTAASKLAENKLGVGGDTSEVLASVADKTIPEANFQAADIFNTPGRKGANSLAALKGTVLAAQQAGLTPEAYIRNVLRHEADPTTSVLGLSVTDPDKKGTSREKASDLRDLVRAARDVSTARGVPFHQFVAGADAGAFADIKAARDANNQALVTSQFGTPYHYQPAANQGPPFSNIAGYDPYRSDRFLKSGKTRSGDRVDAYPGLSKLYRPSGYLDALTDELREGTPAKFINYARGGFSGDTVPRPAGLFGGKGGFVPPGPPAPPGDLNPFGGPYQLPPNYSATGRAQRALPPYIDTSSPTVRTFAARPHPDQFADLAAADRAALTEHRLEAGITSARGSSFEEARQAAALRRAGGLNQLSSLTVGEIQQREHTRAVSDLTKGIQRQLNALYPTISATESYRKAEELATAALKEQSGERVLRGRKGGEVVGLESLALQLGASGQPIGGQGTGVGGLARSGFQKFKDAFAPNGSQLGYFAATATLGALGGLVSPSQAQADAVARSGSGGNRYRAEAAAGGILTGAAAGAGIGLATGNPIAIGVGAAAGALVGLYTSLRDAAKSIDEAKLGQKLNEFGDFLDRVGRKGGGITAGGEATALGNLTAARALTNQKVDRESGGYLFGALPGLNGKERSALLQNNLRESFGGQLGGLIQLLNNRAEAAGRRSPSGDVRSLTGEFSVGLNRELLQLVADIRNVPVGEVLKDFVDVIKAAQISAKNTNLVDLGRRQQDRLVNEGTRLAAAFDNAGVAASKFDQNLSLIGEGTVKYNPIAAGFGQAGAANPGEYNSSLGILSKALGPKLGPGFAAQASANGRVAALLPDVLSTLQGGNLTGESSVGEQVRALLKKQLGSGLDKNPALGRAVDLAVGGITSLSDKPAEFAKRLETDLTQVVAEIVKLFDGPLKEAGEKMAKALDEEAQTFSERLAHARSIADQSSEFSNRGQDAQLARLKYAATLAEPRTGVSAASLVSLQQLQAPFAARQARLAGDAGLDPTAIAARLAAVQTKIPGAADAAAAARGDKTAFAAAASELDKLRGEASNLQQALKNLADSGNRTAAIQDKLSELSASRDSRRGFAEHYLFASPEERGRLQQGQQLIGSTLQNRNNFLNFSEDEQRTTFTALNSLGRSKLAGGVRADLLKNQLSDLLLGANGGAGALSPQDTNEEKQLQAENAKALEDAAVALDKLSEFTQSENTRFLDGLKAAHDEFYNRLATNLATEIANASRNTLGAAQEEKRKLGESGKYADTLGRAGITTDAQTKALLGSREGIGNYIQLTRQIQDLSFTGGSNNKQVTGAADRNVGEILRQQSSYENNAYATEGVERAFGNPQLAARDEAIRKFVEESGATGKLTGTERDSVFQKVRDKFSDPFTFGGPSSFEERLPVAKDTLTKTLGEAVREVTSGKLADLSRQRADVGQELDRNALPFDYRKLADLPQASQDLLFKAAEHFDGVANKLDELGKAIDRNREKIDAATASYGATQSGAVYPARGGLIYRSGGGGVFRPRGTDVIPAMLSPGEFVVNAQSAQANTALLRLMNEGRGTVPIPQEPPQAASPARPAYYAGGGAVDWEGDIEQLKRLGGAFAGGAPPVPAADDIGGGEFDANPAELQAAARAKDVAKALAGADPNSELALAGRQKQLGVAGLLAARNAGNINSFLRQQATLRGAFLPGEDIQAFNASASLEGARRLNDQAFQPGGRFGPSALDRLQGAQAARAKADLEKKKAQQDAIGANQKNVGGALAPLFRKPFELPNYSRPEPTPGEIAKADLDKYKSDYKERQYFKDRGDRLKGEYGVRGFAAGGPVLRFANGGLVPGSGNSDSVPAQLTPGEFVLNKAAVQALSVAGAVGAGGNVSGGSAGGAGVGGTELARALLDFSTKSDTVAAALRLFSGGSEQLSKALDNFPREVQHQGRFEVVVTHVGGEVFQAMEESVAKLVDRKVNEVVSAEFERRVPDAPRPVHG